jgi:mannose-6-phosphate isomerase-like protein (cupin superfamily)
MQQGSSEPLIVQPGGGHEFALGAFSMFLKASGEQTQGAFSLLEAVEPPGFGPPLHVHHDAAETFYVLEGEYIIFVKGESHRCPAGSFVYIPAGMEHTFKVGETPSKKLNLYTPAAMVGYFEELSAASSTAPMSSEQLADMATRYSMEITGPVPEGYR